MKPDYTMYYDEWVGLYLAGQSSTQIANKYGCSHSTVLKVLRTRRVTRSISESRMIDSQILQIASQVEALYMSGFTINEVAEKTGCSSHVVHAYLSKKGLTRNRREGNIIRYNKSHKNVDYFDLIDTEERAYWLGFICADGWIHISNSGHRLGIELAKTDEAHLKKFAAIFDLDVKERSRKQASGRITAMVYCRITSETLCASLIKLGVLPAKSKSDELVAVFDHIPNELLNHFIRGYFDGDGYIHKDKKGQFNLGIVSSPSFVAKIKHEIQDRLPVGNPSIQSASKNNLAYSVTWSGNVQVPKIAQWLYQNATIFLERKYQIAEEVIGIIA